MLRGAIFPPGRVALETLGRVLVVAKYERLSRTDADKRRNDKDLDDEAGK